MKFECDKQYVVLQAIVWPTTKDADGKPVAYSHVVQGFRDEVYIPLDDVLKLVGNQRRSMDETTN